MALLFPLNAFAYCRKTTTPIPADYDPTTEGCIEEGTPLAWQSMPVTYELNQAGSVQVSISQAASIVDAAFAEWADVSCPATATSPAGHPSFTFERLAPTDAGFTNCPPNDEACEKAEAAGPHEILFRDNGWPYDDAANQLALTTVTFGATKGGLRSANIEINSHDYSFSVIDPPPNGEISLTAVVRHEVGHFLGLAHSEKTSAVMYALYEPSTVDLSQDDIEGICTIYPPKSAGDCSATGGSPTAPGSKSGGLGMAALAVAIAWAQRRRTGRGTARKDR